MATYNSSTTPQHLGFANAYYPPGVAECRAPYMPTIPLPITRDERSQVPRTSRHPYKRVVESANLCRAPTVYAREIESHQNCPYATCPGRSHPEINAFRSNACSASEAKCKYLFSRRKEDKESYLCTHKLDSCAPSSRSVPPADQRAAHIFHYGRRLIVESSRTFDARHYESLQRQTYPSPQAFMLGSPYVLIQRSSRAG